MTSRTAAVRHVARFGPLMLIAALAALIWRSNAELIIAAATAAIVLSITSTTLFADSWALPTTKTYTSRSSQARIIQDLPHRGRTMDPQRLELAHQQ